MEGFDDISILDNNGPMAISPQPRLYSRERAAFIRAAAADLKVSPRTVRRWLAGTDAKIHPGNLARLNEALDLVEKLS